jgi:hypothetical protein
MAEKRKMKTVKAWALINTRTNTMFGLPRDTKKAATAFRKYVMEVTSSADFRIARVEIREAKS